MIQVKKSHFSVAQICESGQCFRMSQTTNGRYSVIAMGSYLELWQDGEKIFFDCTQQEYETVWQPYFDLDTDYGDFVNRVGEEDPYLYEAVRFGSGIRILRQNPWEMLITFIISQQNHIRRIRTCVETICREYGEKKESGNGTVFYDFPTPEALMQVSEEEFRACNLGYRSKYLTSTSAMVAGNRARFDGLSERGYADTKQELMKFAGVGEKVADCICLFGFHHLDAFPVDTHIRQVFERHYPAGFPFERYSGYLGVIQQYLFYYDLKRGETGI